MTTAATWRTRAAAGEDGADENDAGKNAGDREAIGPAGWWSNGPSSSRHQSLNLYAASVVIATADVDGDDDAAVDDDVDAVVGAACAPADRVVAAVDVAAAPQPRIVRGRTPLPHSSSPVDHTKRKISR